MWHTTVIVFISTFVTIIVSNGILISTAIRRGGFDGKIVSNRLLWNHTSNGVSTCVGECGRDSQCVSVFYNNVSRLCQGHSVTHGHTDDATGIPFTRYYIMPLGDKYIGDSCVAATDCVTNHSECRADTCLCEPGYSFSPRTRSCITACDTFGTDFMEVADHYISKRNIETYEYITTAEACLTLCVEYTLDTCRTVEYGRTSHKCFLQNITKLDEPSRWHADLTGEFNISYFQRDCDTVPAG